MLMSDDNQVEKKPNDLQSTNVVDRVSVISAHDIGEESIKLSE